MALVLELSPEIEAMIRMKATVRGQDVAEYITALTENDQTIDLTEFEDQTDFDASVEGIQEGLADLEAGRTYSLEETFAYLREQRAARRGAKEAQRDQHFQSAVAP